MENKNIWTSWRARIGGRLLNSPLRRAAELMVMGDITSILNERVLSKLKGDESVLDVGAGSGYYSLLVAKRLNNGKVYCLDASSDMLSILSSKARCKGFSKRIEAIANDASISGLGDNTMDAAITTALLHEIGEPQKVINEMSRVLKPGGLIAIADFRKGFIHAHPGGHGGWEEAELAGSLKKAGIKEITVTEVKRMFFASGIKG